MTENVIPFTGKTTLPTDPDQVLAGAKGKLGRVLVIGFEGSDTGGRLYLAGSHSEVGDALLLLELAKRYFVLSVAETMT